MEKFRVSVIEFTIVGGVTTSALVVDETSSVDELRSYLERTQNQSQLRRQFNIEWSVGTPVTHPTHEDQIPVHNDSHSEIGVPSSADQTLVKLLVTFLGTPPDFFTEHAAEGPGFEPIESRIRVAALHTTGCPEVRHHIDFFNLLDCTAPQERLQWPCPMSQRSLCPGDAGLTLQCEASKRQLQFHRWTDTPEGYRGWLVIAPARFSYWSREMDDGGWDAIGLWDPIPEKAEVRGRGAAVSLTPELAPFRGGYREFIPRRLATSGRVSAATLQVLEPSPFVEAEPLILGQDEFNQTDENITEQGAGNPFTGHNQWTGRDDSANEGAILELGEFTVRETDEWLRRRERRRQDWERAEVLKASIRNALQETVSPRTSPFEDMRYYLSRFPHLLDVSCRPHSTTLFSLKLVASYYALLHVFVSFQTFSMRSTGWALRRETPEQIDDAEHVENSWSRFRCSEYLEALENLMYTLGISYQDYPFEANYFNRPQLCLLECCRRRPAETQTRQQQSQIGTSDSLLPPFNVIGEQEIPQTSPTELLPLWCESAWRLSASDFIYLHHQLRLRRQDYDRITTSIASLTGIITGRTAVSEAKSAKTLTYIALCFAPLSWVASIYSIPPDSHQGPGQALFWMYWASALPVMFLVWLLVALWYTRTRWMRWLQNKKRASGSWFERMREVEEGAV